MQEPKLPENEKQRLEAVEALNILDTDPEEAFDRITRMAARIMDVPIACVTIVDRDRQWFKSRIGLDVSETERRVSFCGHAIHSKSIFVVANAHDDERFNDNPLVDGAPNIAFYIGVPVMSPEGLPVGTLCAINTQPQMPTENQQALMMDLAQLVESELRLRQESCIDTLSGLMNRRQFNRMAEHEVFRAVRSKNDIAVMAIDVDHFKRINDTLGHQVGDKVITAVGEVLPENIKRAGDTIARMGGDEFVAVLVDTDVPGATLLGAKLLEKLNKALREIVGKEGRYFEDASVSIGIAVFRPSDQKRDITEMLAVADQALYESKNGGRDKVTVKLVE